MWNYHKLSLIDDFFDTLSNDKIFWMNTHEKTLKSQMKLLSDKDGTTVWTLDLPGVKRADLSVTQDSDAVRIVGKRGELKFDNKYTFPEEYDVSTATATLEDGVLYLTVLRKTKSFKTRNILQ